MSLDKPLPSRYRIVERNGRLIVTDTVTGTRNASADLPTMADMGRGRAASVAASAPQTQDVAQPVRMLEPSTPRTKRRDTVLPPTSANQVKLILLVIGAVFAVAVLLLSWLWVPLAIALLIPQVRMQLLDAGRRTIKGFFAS